MIVSLSLCICAYVLIVPMYLWITIHSKRASRYSSHHMIYLCLTHWGRVTHRCVSKLTIIDSDNGLSPDRRQANIWTNAAILLIGPLGTNFSEIFIEILTFSFRKMRLKVSSAKQRPFCFGLNVFKWHVSRKSVRMLVKFKQELSGHKKGIMAWNGHQ